MWTGFVATLRDHPKKGAELRLASTFLPCHSVARARVCVMAEAMLAMKDSKHLTNFMHHIARRVCVSLARPTLSWRLADSQPLNV